MALVVVGAMAGTSPAMAANKKAKTSVSKAWQNQHKDNKVFGDAINNLRRSGDQTNFTISKITEQSVAALVALEKGLTTIAGYTTDFKYGVVQIGGASAGTNYDGAPAQFWATPNIQPTGEQSTVTFPIPPTGALAFWTAVRSANPDEGTVRCRIVSLASDGRPWVTLIQGTTTGAFVEMPQSRLVPSNGDKTFPYALVPTEDNVLDLADPRYVFSPAPVQAGGGRTRATTGTTGAMGTLSCFVS
jgi:hypothetical protein